MNNLFQTQLPIHQRYDLKGSTQGRGQGSGTPPGSSAILKDLDLNVQLKLEESWHARYAALDCLAPWLPADLIRSKLKQWQP